MILQLFLNEKLFFYAFRRSLYENRKRGDIIAKWQELLNAAIPLIINMTKEKQIIDNFVEYYYIRAKIII